jgi:Ca-activated chloride channel homolog
VCPVSSLEFKLLDEVSVKRTAMGRAIGIAFIFVCIQANGAQSTAPSSSSVPAVAVTIPSGHKFILQLETPLHTHSTRKGDKVEFRTAADVVVGDQVVIPNRSIVRGTVTKSKRAGMLHGRAEIRLHFEQLELTDGTVLPLQATITRGGFDPVDPKSGEDPKLKGEAGGGADVKAVASAGAQGAIIGIMTGSVQGAAYGAGIGAAVVLVGAALRRGPDLDLPRSTMFEASFDKQLEVPAASVLAQNAPSAGPSPETPPTEPEIAAEETVATARPVLRRARSTPPEDESPVSEPEPSIAATVPVAKSPAGTHPDAKTVETPAGGLTLSVKVNMVQVDAMVRDKAGRTIENLSAADFRVYEDGVLQEIASFSHDELPLAVALVVDRSGSVAAYIAELRRIAARALDQLKPQDQVCLFSFAGEVDRLEDLTTDRRQIADALDRIRAGGSTNITDALYDAAKYLSRTAPDRRHAIILVSDNQQTANPRTSERETINTMLETDAVVYSLKTSGTPLQVGINLPSLIFGDSVNKIAKESGGEVIGVSGVGSLNFALGSVISRLRTRYSLGYYPSGSSQGGSFHEIKVRLAENRGKPGSDYSIHAKRGYYAVSPRNDEQKLVGRNH